MTDKKSRIPVFKSIEEVVFWDTHSFADYWEELKPIKVRFAKKLSDTITIRLDMNTLEELRERADELGIGPTTLARMWILRQLREEKANQSAHRQRAIVQSVPHRTSGGCQAVAHSVPARQFQPLDRLPPGK